jgi:hypothetical protein
MINFVSGLGVGIVIGAVAVTLGFWLDTYLIERRERLDAEAADREVELPSIQRDLARWRRMGM